VRKDGKLDIVMLSGDCFTCITSLSLRSTFVVGQLGALITALRDSPVSGTAFFVLIFDVTETDFTKRFAFFFLSFSLFSVLPRREDAAVPDLLLGGGVFYGSQA
jgi:hypothetical protein